MFDFQRSRWFHFQRSRWAIISGIFVALATAPPTPAIGQSPPVKSSIAYRTVEGHEILADVYRPDDEEVRPTIVWIHGGGLITGGRRGIDRQVRELAAARGYALVSIDYRLAPETKLPELVSDVEAAVAWAAGPGAVRFHLDSRRFVVAGASAGGYLTLTTGYRAKPRPTALVAIYGYGNLVAPWYAQPSTHPRHNRVKVPRDVADQQTDGTVVSNDRQRKGKGGLIYLYYRQNGLWPQEVSGFDRATIADRIAPFEPARNVTPDFPPTLLLHGTEDTDVPYAESRTMAQQLAKHGVSHVLKTIRGGEHGFAGGNEQDIQDAYQTLRAFIDEHLSD